MKSRKETTQLALDFSPSPAAADLRCRHCGIAGHTPEHCALKQAGDLERALEAARRRSLRIEYTGGVTYPRKKAA